MYLKFKFYYLENFIIINYLFIKVYAFCFEKMKFTISFYSKRKKIKSLNYFNKLLFSILISEINKYINFTF